MTHAEWVEIMSETYTPKTIVPPVPVRIVGTWCPACRDHTTGTMKCSACGNYRDVDDEPRWEAV